MNVFIIILDMIKLHKYPYTLNQSGIKQTLIFKNVEYIYIQELIKQSLIFENVEYIYIRENEIDPYIREQKRPLKTHKGQESSIVKKK